jgi:predicted alpha/beta-hydrolase family hydrolase
VVVQGTRDPFGSAADVDALGLPGVEVVAVPADHWFGLRSAQDRAGIEAAVTLATHRALGLSTSQL